MLDKNPLQDETEEKTLLEDKLKALEADLRQKKEIILAQHIKLEAFFESSIDAVVQMDFDGYITGWNHQAEKIFGWSADEILDQTIEDTIIPQRYREAHRSGVQRYLKDGEVSIMNNLIEIHALHRDGHEFPVELSISVIDTPDLQEFNAYIRDISRRKQAESVIWNQANFDTLTNLPNRNLFLQKLEHEIRSSERSNRSLALLCLNLDRFKDINDSLGHDMGDQILLETAERLSKSLRKVDTVSRTSSDQFAIILGSIDDPISVQQVCQKLLESLIRPYHLDTEIIYLTASIGVNFYPDDSGDIETLQHNADQAMYAAKNLGRNRYHFFTPELEERARRKREITNDLRIAMQMSQFEIYYQPIVSMRDGAINQAEALLRWHHPESGLVAPSIFIPIAEEIGLITELGNWVFHNASEQLRYWRERINPDFQVSINTSPLQWSKAQDSMSEWLSQLQSWDIDRSALNLEITEDLLVDADDHIVNRLLEFRDAGVQVSIDDFGTGYTSMAYLKRFDIDYLKIDRSFVRNLEHDPNDLTLCEAIIAMAHKLGIEVIAEGVENEAQENLLRDFGCDFGQGYLFSRAVPVEEFTSLLKNSTPVKLRPKKTRP